MALSTNAVVTYTAIGNREDLSDVIYNISPTETPFMSQVAGKGTARGTIHEWQKDSLAAAAANASLEGEDAPVFAAQAVTIRLRNELQISTKLASVTGTQEVVDKAGRDSELKYQIMKRARELKRDMEFTLCGKQARGVGSTTTNRTFAAMECWFQTNGTNTTPDFLLGATTGAHAASTAGIPDAAAQPTDGTVRDPTEAMLRYAILLAWNQGGDPSVIMCGGINKQKMSAFVGSTTRTLPGNAEDKRFVNGMDVYESDFGIHKVVPNRFMRVSTRTCIMVLTPELWSVDYLRPFTQYPIAKIGDSERRQILAEYTLVSKQEAGSTIIADLNL